MRQKLFAIIVFFCGISNFAFSQITEAEKILRSQSKDSTQGWKKGGVFTLNFSQTSLTNWAAGGQNSISANGLFSGFANYRKGKSVWDNSLDIGYGLQKQGKDESSQKTDDKFDFLSKYGREAFKNFYYAALFNFKTQMAPGYKYPDIDTKISDFLAPAYMLISIGLDYKPNAYFSAFLAPLTGKFTFVNDEQLSEIGAFGVSPGENSLSEFGGYFRVIYTKNDFKSEFLKNVSFTTKLDLFSNYLKNPQNIVVNWENLLSLKVNKFISASFVTQLIYDDKTAIPVDKNGNGAIDAGEGVRSKIQFKEILGVGFSYKF